MEEDLVEFTKWVEEFKTIEIHHWAVFNPETGKIIGLYPGRSADEFESKIEVQPELVESVRKGEVRLDLCSVDLINGELTVVETQSVSKIDDVLHRIIEKKWSQADDCEVFLKYSHKTKKFKVSLTEKFYGNKKSKTPVAKRKIFWTADSEMSLLVTDYNDPNIIHQTITLHLEDLISKDKVFEDMELPTKFSVYTRRLFKNYIIEIT
jgi:hypothetical protein